MNYPIYKLTRDGNLKLWDGPSLSKKEAEKLFKDRLRKYPKEKFFIVKMREN